MSLFSTLIIACSLSTLVLSGDYDMDDKDNNWPTHKVDYKTPRPTKYAPSYDAMGDWHKPSHPKPTYKKTQKPTWKKTKPTKAWTKDSKPTWQKTQKYDHETVEKEAVSHYYNPYDDRRRRSAMKAQLEERIESDKQELAALNELETVSNEQQDLDGEGVIESASTDETVQKE